MTPSTSCPRCTTRLWPQPFVGHVITLCPHCERMVVLSTDGLSFETSRVRATLPVNGEAAHMCHVVCAAAPRV